MLKFVIKSPQLFRKLMQYRRLRPWFPFDLSRLEEIDDEATFVFALQATRLPNGTCKTTNSRRFKSLDDSICKYASELPQQPLKVHDVAASDGITTVNLSDAMDSQSIAHSIWFSDKFSNLYTRRTGISRIVYDQEGTLVYAELLKMLASPYLPSRFWLSRMLGRLYSRKCERRPNEKEVLLLNPLARTRIAEKRMQFFHYDLFDGHDSNGPYHVIRCMNALNPAIFEESLLLNALTKLVKNLDDGGILIIGRTNPSTGENHATIFRLSKLGLEVLDRLGDGSEIESIALGVKLD